MPRLPENKQQLTLQKSSKPLRLLKNKAEPVSSNEIWLLTLSDLLMLLMIFFVFLLAAPVVQSGVAAPSPSKSAAVPVEQPTVVVVEPSVKETAHVPDSQTTTVLERDLADILDNREVPQGVTVERRSQFVVITFPEQILFDSGQAQMKTVASPTLQKVATFIINHPELSVEVQGHTDDRPIRSQRYPSNWELSADRATQVAKVLVQLGADPTKIATKGFGEYHPLTPNESEADRLKNRRVEIQFSLGHS